MGESMQLYLPTEHPSFPSFLRLYWDEIQLFLLSDLEFNYFNELKNHLEEENVKYFEYVFKVLRDPVAVINEHMRDKKAFRTRRRDKRDQNHAQSTADKDNKKIATDLREQVLTAFIRRLLFDVRGIKKIDEMIKHNHRELWQKLHLDHRLIKEPKVALLFLEKFFRQVNEEGESDELFLDRIATSFQPQHVIKSLKTKFEPTTSVWLPFLEEMEKDFGSKKAHFLNTQSWSRAFLRSLPMLPFSTDDWFFDLVEACAKDPYNSAVLMYLLPKHEEILAARELEMRAFKIKRIAPVSLIPEIDETEPTEMRPPKDYVKDREYEDTYEPKELVLRSYQEELVSAAISSNAPNVIICAPTGSGKTEVAVYIAKHHLNKKMSNEKSGRVVMLVPKVPLVEQQKKRFHVYCRGDYYIDGFHGLERPRSISNSNIFLRADVMIMTPQVLINMLRSVRKNERVYICDISLLIFDEVHHCDKGHAYKELMDMIAEYSYEKPQIIGLTASLVRSSSQTIESALNSIYSLMANVTATALSTVLMHQKALNDFVQRPAEEYFKISTVPSGFQQKIRNVIDKIKNRIKPYLDDLKKKNELGFSKLQPNEAKIANDYPIKSFIESVRRLQEVLKKISGVSNKSEIMTACKFLVALGMCLGMAELMPYKPALVYLNKEIEEIAIQFRSPFTERYHEFYLQEKDGLEGEAKEQARSGKDCEILEKLKSILLERFKADSTSRGIIFVQERSTAYILCEHFNNIRLLGGRADFGYVISARAQGESGFYGQKMTEQKMVLNDFNTGIKKVIVSTSVLDEGLDVKACNLIIKYNCTSSAVSRIQKSGRARARDSKSYLLCLDRSTANAEYDAIIAENAMKEALVSLNKAGPKALERCVRNVMENNAKARSRNLEVLMENMKKLAMKEYDVCCPREHLICRSLEIRLMNNNHVVIDKEIWDRVRIVPKEIKNERHMDQSMFKIGKALCMGNGIDECGEDIGNIICCSGVYLPTLKVGNLVFVEHREGNARSKTHISKKSWDAVHNELFYVNPAIESDVKRMLQALAESNSQPEALTTLDTRYEQMRMQIALFEERKRREKENMRIRANLPKKLRSFEQFGQRTLSSGSSSESLSDIDEYVGSD
ncbi:unnamed protein product [Auanema sp. JU1783]|nr:unnamed protein product [Auanema sp. JU1783]